MPASLPLQAVAVSKCFPGDVWALRDVSFEVAAGETLALVGESGSGKTTLLRLFNRLEEPTGGRILVEGREAADLDAVELRRHTGYVPQHGGLLPHWTVERNVELVPSLLGWPIRRRRERAAELLDLVGLPHGRYGARYPSELSGGQRQRVAVARALAADPRVVLLDEPFGALDAITRLELHRQFEELERRLAKTMVLVTHDLEEAFRLADRIGVMRAGRLVQIGAPQHVQAHPEHEYVERLLRLRRGRPRHG